MGAGAPYHVASDEQDKLSPLETLYWPYIRSRCSRDWLQVMRMKEVSLGTHACCSVTSIPCMQEVARASSDPVAALRQQGLYIRDSAMYYLTPAQLAAVEAELEAMEASMSFEVTAWVVTDCLQRAARANERMPTGRRE